MGEFVFNIDDYLLLSLYLPTHTNSDSAVHALQFLDVINMKDPTQKAHFYRNTLKDALPFIPRVSTLLFSLSSYEKLELNVQISFHK